LKFPYHEIPLFKPLILFMSGIIASEYLEVGFRLSWLLVYLIIGLLIVMIIRGKINSLFYSLFMLLICFAFGFINHQERSINQTKTYVQEQALSIRIDKILAHEKHKKCFATSLALLDQGISLKKSERKLLVYFKGLANDSSIVVGNEYLIKGRPFPIPKSTNPYSFDYKRYLNHQGIYEQLFLDSQQIKLIRKNQNSYFDQVIQSVRNRCLFIFEKYFPEKNKLGVLQAMVLGKRDELDQEINQAFIDTGAIHVLAVSGLHVGILSLFITMLFKGLVPVFRISKLRRGIISVLLIWLFAMITGGSPAVCRAALMFSLFYIAKDVIHRQVSIYNVLCATAFILLAINPSQVFQVGFQFSFLAVLSIVFFYPYVSSIIVTRFKVINYLISSVALGIAAQILVFPLSIFYFNKFANSFLISSLFVVQFAMVILVGGLILLILETIDLGFLNQHALVPVLDFVLELFEYLIKKVQSMPMSASENLWLDGYQLIMIYFCILCFMYFLKRSRKYLYFGLVFFFALINYTVGDRINKQTQQVAYVYDAKELCVDVMIGNKVLHLGGIDKKEAGFIYARNRLSHFIDLDFPLNNISTQSLEYNNGIIRLGNYLLAFANEKTLATIKKDQEIDYLLVTKDYADLKSLDLEQLKGPELIIDGSLKFWERDKIIAYAIENGLRFYDVKTEGAKRIDFR